MHGINAYIHICMDAYMYGANNYFAARIKII